MYGVNGRGSIETVYRKPVILVLGLSLNLDDRLLDLFGGDKHLCKDLYQPLPLYKANPLRDFNGLKPEHGFTFIVIQELRIEVQNQTDKDLVLLSILFNSVA